MTSQIQNQMLELLQKNNSNVQNFSLMPNQNISSDEQQKLFMEQHSHLFNQPSLSGLKNKILNIGGGVSVIALTAGVVLSSMIGGWIANMLPSIANYATLIAGILGVAFFKSGMLRDFSYGVLIAGIANLIQPAVMSATSGLSLPGFSEGGRGMMRNEFAEDRVTLGGTDGITVTSPGRATFR